MNLKKIWLIVKREYWVNFRRKSFLFTAFGMPILLGVVMAVVIGLIQNSTEDISGYKAVGVVDKSGVLVNDSKPTITLSKPFVLIASTDEAASQLRDKKIDGYYVVPADFVQSGAIDAYYNANAAFNEGLRDSLGSDLKKALASRVGDPQIAARLQSPLSIVNVYRVGNPQKLDEGALIAAAIVPILVGILVFSMTMGTSQMLIQGLVEEKENRMMELFMTSARPSEMLWGKLIGIGGLGLTLVVTWIVMGMGFLVLRGTLDIGQTLANFQLTPGYFALVLTYTLLGYFLFGSLMAGFGATVNAELESRQIASVISIIGIVPMMLSFAFFTDPNGSLPTFLSLFPFTAPTAMLFRAPLTVVPSWQVFLSIALMILTLVAVMWLSARIFRMGMLSYGKRMSLREILRGLRERQGVMTTTAKTREVSG